jgi:hypothetical protein
VVKHHRRQSDKTKSRRLPEQGAAVPALVPMKPREYGTTKEVVTRAFGAVEGGVPTVMALLDLGKSTVYGYTDPLAQRSDMTLDQARRITQVLRVAVFAEDLAALAGGAFLPPPSEDGKTLAGLTALAQKEMGELVGRLLHALENGVVDGAERRALREELDELLRPLLEVRGLLNDGGAA